MNELISRLKAKPVLAGEILAATFFATILALAAPLYVTQILNRYVAQGVDATLATLTVGAVIAVALEYGFRRVRIRLAQGVSAGPDRQTAATGFARLTRIKQSAIDRLPPPLRQEIMSGAVSVELAYNATNICAVLDVPFALLFVGVLFLLSPLLAGIVVFYLALVFALSALNAGAMAKKTQNLSAVSGAGGALLNTAIRETETVRAFNAGDFLRRGWETQLGHVQDLRRRLTASQGHVQAFTQSIAALMSLSVIAVGGVMVVRGELDVGAMIGANILAARGLQPISRFAMMGSTFAKARQALDALREFSRLPVESETGSAKRSFSGALEFRDVAFLYPGASAPLFESLSLNIGPGAVVMVTGGNGAGKTTLARLLLGLRDPSRGQIFIDGLDLRQAVPEWWRKQVIYMPQEPAFLNGTIRDNLLAANSALDESGLNTLIDSSGLRSFIDESEHGFDTPVIDNGRTWALGIRRRLGLARALANDGMLAVFDEPIDGLDAQGQATVFAVMNDLAKRGRTVIALSHNPKILKGAFTVVDLNSKPVPRIVTPPRAVESDAERPVEEGTGP